MKPQAGGEYVYVRDAYGPLAGFLYSWTWFLIAKPASIATITTGLVRSSKPSRSFPFSPTPAFHILHTHLRPTGSDHGHGTDFWLNYIGVRRAGEFQFLFTLLKVAIILGIVAVASPIAEAHGQTSPLSSREQKAAWPAFSRHSWLRSGLRRLERPEHGGGRDPQSAAQYSSRADLGVATVGALYILMNAAVQYVLPAAAVAASERPASDAVALVLGTRRQPGVGGHGGFHARNFERHHHERSPRAFATARDGYFFKAIAEVHPRFHTPSVSIVVQCGLAIVLLLLGGSFRQFFSLTIFAEWLFYMIAGSTVFVFRRRDPHADRPYRVLDIRWFRRCLSWLPPRFSTTPSPAT